MAVHGLMQRLMLEQGKIPEDGIRDPVTLLDFAGVRAIKTPAEYPAPEPNWLCGLWFAQVTMTASAAAGVVQDDLSLADVWSFDARIQNLYSAAAASTARLEAKMLLTDIGLVGFDGVWGALSPANKADVADSLFLRVRRGGVQTDLSLWPYLVDAFSDNATTTTVAATTNNFARWGPNAPQNFVKPLDVPLIVDTKTDTFQILAGPVDAFPAFAPIMRLACKGAIVPSSVEVGNDDDDNGNPLRRALGRYGFANAAHASRRKNRRA